MKVVLIRSIKYLLREKEDAAKLWGSPIVGKHGETLLPGTTQPH
jgi:hypothetical protein